MKDSRVESNPGNWIGSQLPEEDAAAAAAAICCIIMARVSITFLTSSIHNLALPTRFHLYHILSGLFVLLACDVVGIQDIARIRGTSRSVRAHHQLLIATNNNNVCHITLRYV